MRQPIKVDFNDPSVRAVRIGLGLNPRREEIRRGYFLTPDGSGFVYLATPQNLSSIADSEYESFRESLPD